MLFENLKKYKIILGSKSPRRSFLLKELGIDFEVQVSKVKEVCPEGLGKEEIALHLAEMKAQPFLEQLKDSTLLITADTIVWIDGEILGKPKSFEGAKEMIRKLSGNKHWVITGVCIQTKDKKVSFTDSSEVTFKELTDSEIDYYIENYKPYDKAGAYGVQEFIGYIGIEKINGSYFNVMGLPIHRVYEELKKF